jgi:hypothetical protein
MEPWRATNNQRVTRPDNKKENWRPMTQCC